MPWELIYTSAPRGLVSGQSGFCTVARTSDLREAVAQRLEQISSYHYLEFSGTGATTRNPTISAYRMLDIRGTRFHAVTRILPCGLDFTKRTNHLAHHLVFAAEELAGLPSPAAILRHWNGWQSTWQGEPRMLPRLSVDAFAQLPQPALPAKAWLEATGDAGRAAGLLENEFARGCHLITPPGGETLMLELFCETLQLVNPSGKSPLRAWQHTFTTFLQGEDSVGDFHWRALRQGTPAYKQALGRSATLVPLSSIRIPNNPLARLAREGPKFPTAAPVLATPVASGAPVLRKPLTLAKGPSRNQFAPAGRAESAGDPSVRPVARSHSPGGWTISVSKSSLIGFGIACALLGALVGLLQWMKKHKTAPAAPVESNMARTTGATPTQPLAETTTGAKAANANFTAPPIVPRLTEPPFDPVEANKELDAVLPSVPTYVFMTTNVQSDDIPLTGVAPMRAMLQQYSRLELMPRNLEMRYDINVWGSYPKYQAKVEPYGSPHKLIGRVIWDNQLEDEFIFDFPGLLDRQAGDEVVHLQTRFHQGSSGASSFLILFRPIAAGGADPSRGFEQFQLLIMNQRRPQQAPSLDAGFLLFNSGKQMARFREPLQKRLEQFRWPGPVSWQLRPYVNVMNTNNAIEARDLYSLLQPDVEAENENELDFARVMGLLRNKCDVQRADMDKIQKEIAAVKADAKTDFDWSVPVGKFLGLTNNELLSFDNYVAAHKGRRHSARIFVNYLNKVVETAKSHQPWLGNWKTDPESAPHQLQELYDLLAANLPAQTVSELNEGNARANYFVAAWQHLRSSEATERLMEEKANIEARIQRLQACMAVVPDSLNRIAYARLFVATSQNTQLEVLRFSNQKKP